MGHNLRKRPGAGLISANNDLNNYERWPEVPPLRIGGNVWIEMNSIVLSWTTIGDNIVIASNAVVMKDIPSNSIPAGKLYKAVREKDPYQGKNYSEL